MEEFLASLTGKSESTRQAYRRDLLRLERHLGQGRLSAATASELKEYFSLLAKEASASSFSRAVSAVRSYFRFMKQKRGLECDPMENVSAGDFAPQTMPVLDSEDFEKLLTVSFSGIRGMRDQAMIVLLCETGIRVSELVAIDRGDFDGERRLLLCGKGKKRRPFVLSSETSRLLRQYLSVAQIQAPKEDAFFLGSANRRLTRQGFWKILREHGARMGIEDCTPQILRQSFAKRLLLQGETRGQVKLLLGNGSDAALRKYEKQVKDENKWDC